ncbi:MAG TPA: hypothetical protein VHU92_00700 [Streptosporangiaceae bacterium]|jgi:hypothetical protein|nr:hypothetical protein [Streptosporangiaceae bacterium]
MPEPRPHHAALAERNRLLTQTRTLTFGIAGGAALASLALGAAFAHALPGHSYHPSAAKAAPVAARSSSPAAQSSRPAGHAPSGRRRAARAHRHARRHHAIAPPTHAPAPAPSSSPPQVTSGGT